MGKKNFTIRPFEKLQKQINKAVSAPLPAQKKKESTEEELFHAAMEDVEVIEAFRALSYGRRGNGKANPDVARRNPEREAHKMLAAIAEGTVPINLADTQEYVEWANPEYGALIKEHLQEGRFSIQAFLDLHGCTVPEAEAELDQFLHDAFVKGVRCVKVIHGRGLRSVNGPRIKDAIIRRLIGHYRREIVAYTSARQCDGGLGALYVLLR